MRDAQKEIISHKQCVKSFETCISCKFHLHMQLVNNTEVTVLISDLHKQTWIYFSNILEGDCLFILIVNKGLGVFPCGCCWFNVDII